MISISSKQSICTRKCLTFYALYFIISSFRVTDATGFFQSVGNVLSDGLQSIGSFYCSGMKCCSFHLNDEDTMEAILSENLDTKLYGQHIARDLIKKAVALHRKLKPVKALGIGLHGWTGTGKNYISQMIAEGIYKQGMQSPLVHVLSGRTSFPVDGEINDYKKNLIGWIRGNVSQCGHSMFVFDECEKWPPTLLDVIKPFLDYHAVIEGVDYRNAIFLFLSNSGGSVIGERVLALHEEGVIREELQLHDFHHGITLDLFNEEGGFRHSDILRGDGIDFHIPFLPMEEKHVKLCIIDHFKLKNTYSPSPAMITWVLERIKYGPENNPVFSLTGCKRVQSLVVELLSKARFAEEL